MAGTLTISTLSDGTNSTSSTNCIQGSAKAWASFNGTNGAINASFNISSITRTAAGKYTATMTTALASADYSLVVSSGPNSATFVVPQTDTTGGYSLASRTTTVFSFGFLNNGFSGWADPSIASIAVFR